MKNFIAIVYVLAAVLVASCTLGAPENKSAATPAEASPAPLPDALAADSAHYTVLFENDVARLLRIKYPAGAKSAMHNHPAGCGVNLVDQKFKFTLQTGQDQTNDGQMGSITCFDAQNHLPQNVGEKEAELVLLELKNRKTFDNVQTGRPIPIPSKPNTLDSVSTDPKHYAVQFENDVVRVVRIKYGAGERSPTHGHPANCAILLTDANFNMGDGQPLTPGKAGDVNCGDVVSHTPHNVGGKSTEVILIEFKKKEKFKA